MAKATKKDKEITLETVLWNCRVALRGVGSMEKNRDAVIGLAFLKFAGDKFDKRRAELLAQYGDIPVFLEKPSFYNAVNVFYLKDTARWSYIVKNAGANDIAVILDQAMADIEEANPSLKGALLQNFYATLGAPKEKTKALIDEVNKISETRFHEEDLIGRVYEYFLQIYAASGTKEDGEFYTPACVVKLIAEMIEPFSGTVYDPCCGSGGMFVQSHKFIERHQGNRTNISVIGQESVPDTWRLCKMNLAIRGISHDLGEKNASTFTDDQHKDRKFDFIMANPPFNLKGWRGEDELLDDPRWDGYVVPRVSNANYAWILHIISKLDVNHGIAGFLLANGALNDPDEYENRKRLLMNDKIEAIIVLPRDMFYTTDISVTLWLVNMNKRARMISWKVGIETGFKLSVGKNYKFIERYISEDLWEKLLSTYRMDSYENIWEALFLCHQLFRAVSGEVAERLHYAYLEYDRNITKYTRDMYKKYTGKTGCLDSTYAADIEERREQ